jgi:hypothetical protein
MKLRTRIARMGFFMGGLRFSSGIAAMYAKD